MKHLKTLKRDCGPKEGLGMGIEELSHRHRHCRTHTSSYTDSTVVSSQATKESIKVVLHISMWALV